MSTIDSAEPGSEEAERRSDKANWATSGRLRLNAAPPQGAINLNVDGRVVTSPIQGFGKMWQKTYRVRLSSLAASPEEVIREWKAHFPTFWPPGNRFYGPLTGLVPGDVALLNLMMPGRQKLSTGVLVLYADEESFTLMTPQGHVFAGWITFSAFAESDETVVQAQVLMRASDPAYELGLTLGGHAQENRFWEHTLTRVAAHFQQQGPVETSTLCIDPRRQWRRAGNIWHNAGIRTGLYVATTPARWVGTGMRRIVRK
ncbi:MAG TPA: hypothetical protein VMM78_06505 [Thermomicrobiales bacterium]|nr:hypothetical protein [Thermomicrobiales bacterium]